MFDRNGVRRERTNWRDEKISARHRQWGFNCPAVDLDFLMVEYNLGKAVAIVEYKHEGAQMPNFNHPTYRALSDLATIGTMPFLVAFYNNEDWWFRIHPVNAIAQTLYHVGQGMSELEFVKSLYTIRKRAIEQQVLQHLYTIRPPERAK